MKYDKYNMDEDYPITKKPRLNSGYVKNSKKEISDQEKDNIANDLLSKNIDNKTIFGYLSSNGLKVKYDSKSEVRIEFNDKDEIVLVSICSLRDYNSNKAIYYENEL